MPLLAETTRSTLPLAPQIQGAPSSLRTPWLSVILPCYRGERWIGATLDSLAAEADDGVEILVIDSSPDSSALDIVRGYSDRLRLRIFERPDLNMWHSKTNFAVAQAQAAHACWLHADDLWLPGRIAALRQWINNAPDAALHLAPCAIIDADGKRLGVWRCPLQPGEVGAETLLQSLLVQNFIAAPAPVFRRDAWLACGGLDEALWYTADWDLWLKLASQGPVRYHDVVTSAFRIHAHSLTATGSRDLDDFARQMQCVLARHADWLSRAGAPVMAAAQASICLNVALAGAAAGDYRRLAGAIAQLLRLGPAGARTYFHASRIVERLAPRLRAKIGGAF